MHNDDHRDSTEEAELAAELAEGFTTAWATVTTDAFARLDALTDEEFESRGVPYEQINGEWT